MRSGFKWIRVGMNVCLVLVLLFSALYHITIIYLIYQAGGQLTILLNKEDIQHFAARQQLPLNEKQNLLVIGQVKKYSVDSLAYKPTGNFTSVYDQHNAPSLWVITACEPYSLKAYEWDFPVVGTVTYKGFFKKELAEEEMKKLTWLGYDVDLRAVSAWSTLGWFSDPVLSNTLKRSRGEFCNLLFHELFHATYYAKNSIDFNENIANFVAHKATLQFLSEDTLEKKKYEESVADNLVFNNYMLRQFKVLNDFYHTIKNEPLRQTLKLKKLQQIADSISYLPLKNVSKFKSRKEMVLRARNAYFIDFEQYESKQDSLESVFNKIYRGNIKKLVQDLTINKTNY